MCKNKDYLNKKRKSSTLSTRPHCELSMLGRVLDRYRKKIYPEPTLQVLAWFSYCYSFGGYALGLAEVDDNERLGF